MEHIDMLAKMRSAVKEIDNWATTFANLKPVQTSLEDLTKVILSEEMLKHQDVPMWKAEALARTSEGFKTHLDGLKDATHRANLAYAKLEVARAKFDALRSLCANETAKLKAGVDYSEGA